MSRIMQMVNEAGSACIKNILTTRTSCVYENTMPCLGCSAYRLRTQCHSTCCVSRFNKLWFQLFIFVEMSQLVFQKKR